MNIYDLILFMWITILTSIFIYFVIDMLDRTKKLKNTVDELKAYINIILDPQIKNIRKLVTDEIVNKKEGASTNSKAGYYEGFQHAIDILKKEV